MSEAFTYKWTNNKTGMFYIGVHKGSQEDGYISSSRNEDFWNDYWNNKDDFIREIIDTGTYDNMEKLEHKLLKEVDAKNNPNYYNNSTGGFYKGPKETVDFNLVESIYENIFNGEYEITKRKTLEVRDYDRKQVRLMKLHKSKVDAIKERINANSQSENDKMISPIIVVDNYHGSTILLDGNHTIEAIAQNNIPEARVIAMNFTDLGESELNLTQLGLRLNKVEDLSTNNDDDDIKKTLREYYSEGIAIDTREFKKDFAEQLGLSMKQIGVLVAYAMMDIDQKASNFKSYEAGKAAEELQQIVARAKDRYKDSSVIYCQSRRVLENGTGQIMKSMLKEGKSKGIIYCYHRNQNEEKSHSDVVAKASEMFSFHGLDVEVRLLPSYEL